MVGMGESAFVTRAMREEAETKSPKCLFESHLNFERRCPPPGVTLSDAGKSHSRSHTQNCSLPAQTPVSHFFATTSSGSPTTKAGHLVALIVCSPSLSPDLSLTQILDIFQLLTETYPRYIDTPSRDAVQQLAMRLVQKDEAIRDTPKLGVLDHVLGWLENEVAHISKPSPRSALSPHSPSHVHGALSPQLLCRS